MHSKNWSIYLSVIIILISLSNYSVANQTVTKKITSPAIADNKPIDISADNQQIDIEKNVITFSGHVQIVQEGLRIIADKVVITDMHDSSKQKITGYGNPVRFKQVMPEQQKDILGKAQRLIYNVKQNTVVLIENAELVQQDNQINSENITYDITKRTILASSGKNGRVKTTIIPNQVKEIKK